MFSSEFWHVACMNGRNEIQVVCYEKNAIPSSQPECAWISTDVGVVGNMNKYRHCWFAIWHNHTIAVNRRALFVLFSQLINVYSAHLYLFVICGRSMDNFKLLCELIESFFMVCWLC